MDVPMKDPRVSNESIAKVLKEKQKYSKKLLNQPLVVGMICVVFTVSLTLIGTYILELHFDNKNMYKPSKVEIQITDYGIVLLNREQKIYDIGVSLSVENPKFSQRSITVEQTSIFINIPNELRHELINISDYYNDRNWMESYSYSHGRPLTIKPGDVETIEIEDIQHTFILLVPGEYQVRVTVDYHDNLYDYPPLNGYFNIILRESGSIILKEDSDIFPIKLS